MRTFAKIKHLFQTDKLESGRSMVEMLGVLAIIGVLSVGAIAGYSHAMMKHKMNKSIAIINHVAQNILELSGKKFSYINTREQFHQYGIISEALCPSDYVSKVYIGSRSFCPLPVGELYLYVDSNNGRANPLGIYAEIAVYFLGSVSERTNNCINFLSYHWEKVLPQEWWGPEGKIEVGMGMAELSTQQEISLNDIQQACEFVCSSLDLIMMDKCSVLMRPKH